MRWTKCQSGYEKKKKRQRLEAAAQSQKSALDRFVVMESRINQTPDANVDDGRGDNVEEIEDIAELDERNDDSTHNEGNDQPDDEDSDANDDDEGNYANIGVKGNDATVCNGTNSYSHPDIFDPRFWDGLDPKMIDIAYKILLTIPITVASAERSFSKLKLLKSYMRSTMTQERLRGLATIALESEILEKINYNDMIEDFISRNT
jgi:hypothetical protein